VRIHADDRELALRAAAAGVIVSPGRPYFAAEPTGSYLRLTFAAEPPERLAEGVLALRRLEAGAGQDPAAQVR
jgi:DNA-binding transcriptional MocR family regulator